MTFVVGDYRAIELIGTGGTAQVWRGAVVDTGAPVALKVFAPDQLTTARREAALAAAVDHPHVVRVIDVVGDAERAVLVTELATGGDLADLLHRRGRLTPGETLTVLIPLAAALATAHERQIVHGDLSAQNVLFDRAGRPLLADLGAGRAAAEGGRPVAVTPTDAAPELARGGVPGAATDMFSLGSLALACLTGRHAWPADDLRDVLIQAAAGQWPDPADVDGPPLLISSVRSLLEHDADRRPGAASLVMDLRAAGRPEPLDLQLGNAPVSARAPAGARPEVPTGGRHELPAEPSARVSGTSRDEHHLDLGRVGRARAVTRIRADAPAPPTPVPLSRPRRVRAFLVSGPGGPGPRSGPARPAGNREGANRTGHRRAARVAALALVTLVVAGLAGAGGLWWARWDRTDPVALDRISSSASAAAASVRTTPTSTPDPTAVPDRTSVDSARPSSTRPSSTRPTSPRRASTPPTSAAAQTPSRPVAAKAPASPGSSPSPAQTRADFTQTVRDLDGARARALVTRNAALLDAVYTSDSAARSVDAGLIASLISGGLRLSGAGHVVHSTRIVSAAPLRVEVDDSLPSYLVLDAGGTIVGSTTSSAVSARVMLLVKTPAGYRISAVQAG